MRQKILLIDDSAMLRRIAASVLQAPPARYEVLTATRASEGFAQACGGEVRLILVDYRLAGADRLDFCRRLLAEPRTARLPVVLLVGRGMPVPDTDARPENVVAILVKPFAPEQVVGMVNAVLACARASPGLRELSARLQPADSVRPPPVERSLAAPDADLAASPIREGLRVREEAPAMSAPVPDSRVAPLGEASLRTILRQAAERRVAGVLCFRRLGHETTDVYFEAGRPLAVSTRDAQTYSEGAALLLPPKVSPATLDAALEEQTRTGVPFLLTLGARGLLSKAAAVALTQRFGKRQLAQVWARHPRAVECAFEPLENLPGFALRLDGAREGLDAWLFDALRLLQPAEVAADARHEGCVGTPAYLPGGEARLPELSLTRPEQDFARRINGRTDLPTLARVVGGSVEEAYLLLCRFRGLEIMDYRPAPAPFVMTPRTNLRRVLPLAR